MERGWRFSLAPRFSRWNDCCDGAAIQGRLDRRSAQAAGKHRFSANKLDFDFNRRCDSFPVSNQKEGALLVSVVTPLHNEYELFNKNKCAIESMIDDGNVLIRLGNDESLGRELRTYIQTEKYLSRKNDGTLSESTKRILRDCADDNRQRRERLTTLLGEMLAAAEYFVAGQLGGDKAKATSTSHRKKLQKEQDDLKKQEVVLRTFEEKLKHAADQKITLDLDDGVKVNYAKFGDLLAESKAITGGKDEE